VAPSVVEQKAEVAAGEVERPSRRPRQAAPVASCRAAFPGKLAPNTRRAVVGLEGAGPAVAGPAVARPVALRHVVDCPDAGGSLL
jgi:hypothetical protein